MKQNITEKQFNELSDKGKEKLLKFCKTNRRFWYDKHIEEPQYNKKLKTWVASNIEIPYLLSIGQMIEFLKDAYLQDWGTAVFVSRFDFPTETEVELCDALWGAVRKVLER